MKNEHVLLNVITDVVPLAELQVLEVLLHCGYGHAIDTPVIAVICIS
jgi:hypothetical protein